MPYSRFTLEDLRSRLAAKREDRVQWTPEEERLVINEALRFWNLLTQRWRRRITMDTVSSQVEYTLPSTLLSPLRISISAVPLTLSSLIEIDLMRPTWRSETVASGGTVPTTPLLWMPISLLRVGIWPATNSAVVGGLVADGVAVTPVLTEGGDTLDLGEEHLEVLLNCVLHLLTFKVGGATFQATLPAYQTFLQAAAEENGRLKANQAFRRWAGLDRRRDLQQVKRVATRLDPLAAGESV